MAQKLYIVIDASSEGTQFGLNYQGEFYGGEIITSFEKLNEE